MYETEYFGSIKKPRSNSIFLSTCISQKTKKTLSTALIQYISDRIEGEQKSKQKGTKRDKYS